MHSTSSFPPFSAFPSAYWAEQDSQNSQASSTSWALIWERGSSSELSSFFSALPDRFSWSEFHQLLKQTSHFLRSLGVKPNQIIAYSGNQRFLALLCYCATVSLGARILMLNPALKSSQLPQILQDNAVDLCVTDEHFLQLESHSLLVNDLAPLDFAQPATFTLTSGSSGKPKAVVHSIQNHLENAMGVCELMDFRRCDSWLLSLPLFHVSGQGIVWRWLLTGATLVINEEKSTFWQSVQNVSHASLVPTQLQRYLATKPVLTRSQHILLGGSFIPPELVQHAQDVGITTYVGYGMTECASTICAVKNEVDNAGKPLNGREVKIDPITHEIWVKGAGLALGYWLNGELSPITNSQGWLQTKDRGQWNSQGQLVVRGRLDNMFISGGENIQPEDIEATLMRSNLLENVMVVPVEDAEFGQRPVAFVAFQDKDTVQAGRSLAIFAQAELEKFKQPIAYLPLDVERYQRDGIKISRAQLQRDVLDLLGKQQKND